MRNEQATDEEKKILQNSTRRLIEIKLTLASHKRRAFLRIPYRIRKKTFFLHFEFTQTFPLSRSSMTRNKFEIFNALHHLSASL